MIDELFCPYCGLTKDTNAFWTKEVLQQINDIASNYMAEQLNKLFGNMVRDTNRQHGIIKMRYTPLKKLGFRNCAITMVQKFHLSVIAVIGM